MFKAYFNGRGAAVTDLGLAYQTFPSKEIWKNKDTTARRMFGNKGLIQIRGQVFLDPA